MASTDSAHLRPHPGPGDSHVLWGWLWPQPHAGGREGVGDPESMIRSRVAKATARPTGPGTGPIYAIVWMSLVAALL